MSLTDLPLNESFSADEAHLIAVVLEDAAEDGDREDLRELSARFWNLKAQLEKAGNHGA